MARAFYPPMRIPIAVALCWCAAVSGCEREKSPEELLTEDTTLAMDLARANDALDSGDPDTLIALVDDDAPLTDAPRTPEPHIEPATPDPGVARPTAEPRTSTPPARVSPPPRPTVPASPPTGSRVIPASAPGCNSPTTADQRRCLLELLARYDVGLNAAYRDLIRRMRRDAGADAGEPDPASVRELRAAQRSWLVYRDRECRRRTRSREGQLWGPVRAQCLGQLSDARAAELRSM